MDIEDDIGADIAAAMKGDAPAAVEAPAPIVETPAVAEVPATPRDEQGRFAPKAEAPAEQPKIPDQPAAQATEAQPEPIRPPASWSAQAKADFSALPAHIQQEVLKREDDVSKGFEERATQLKRYEPLEQVIAPHRQRLAMAGVDEAGYFRSLIAADEMLRGPNRLQALAQIAQSYGVDLRQLVQPGQQQPQAAQLPPEYQHLATQVQALQQQLAQQTTASQQAEQDRLNNEVQAFAKDNLYFENVRSDMAALLQAGVAKDIGDAYQKACWARDDIRPLLLKEEDQKRQAQATEAARAKANQAKAAAGSITGSPLPGSSPAQAANTNSSIEDDVRAAVSATRSSVR